MIDKLRIDGFRGLDDVRLDALGQFNLIVGPGNVGKTNLLEAMFLFCSNGDPTLIPTVLGFRRIEAQHLLPRDVSDLIDWFWSVGRKERSFEIEGRWAGKDRFVRVSKLSQEMAIPLLSPDADTTEEELRDALAVYELETRMGESTFTGYLRVMRDTVRVKTPATANIRGRFVSPLEQGMSRALATTWSEIEDREEQDWVLALLKSLDSDVVDVRIRADELGRAFVRIHHKRLGRAPVEILGAGFGKALSIACYILATRDGLLMIDEFDASLHVGAQLGIIEFLMRAAEKHNVQVCASTHSIETLDAFLDAYANLEGLFNRPEALRVLQLKRVGSETQITSLNVEEARRLREEVGFDLRCTA